MNWKFWQKPEPPKRPAPIAWLWLFRGAVPKDMRSAMAWVTTAPVFLVLESTDNQHFETLIGQDMMFGKVWGLVMFTTRAAIVHPIRIANNELYKDTTLHIHIEEGYDR